MGDHNPSALVRKLNPKTIKCPFQVTHNEDTTFEIPHSNSDVARRKAFAWSNLQVPLHRMIHVTKPFTLV